MKKCACRQASLVRRAQTSLDESFWPTLTDGPAVKKSLWTTAGVTAFYVAQIICAGNASASGPMALTNDQLDHVTAGSPSAISNADAAAVGQTANGDVSVATGVATVGVTASAIGSTASSASSTPAAGAAYATSSLYLSITLP